MMVMQIEKNLEENKNLEAGQGPTEENNLADFSGKILFGTYKYNRL
jgi:hypothetical protein